MSTARPRPNSFARLPLVISLLALVIALSGTAVAATLAANSVGTKQLKKNAVTSAKIKGNAVKGADVKNGSLRAQDLAAGTLPPDDVAFQHQFGIGDPQPPQIVVAGLEFNHTCANEGGDITVRTIVVPVSDSNNVNVSGIQVSQVGAVTTTNPVYGTGLNSFTPEEDAPPGTTARLSFEGLIRTGGEPWVRMALHALIDGLTGECHVRGLLTLQR